MDRSVLFSTFGLVFVAELGDKTQLAILAQTCKYRRPWAVFLGASLALTAVTALGAVGGQVLGRIIPGPVLRYVAALAFVTMGVLIGREAARAQADEAAREAAGNGVGDEGKKAPSRLPSAWDWKAFGSTFGLLFAAEMGDKTQLAVLGLAGRYGAPCPVFIGGALALTVVTALGVIGGQGLSRLIPERLLRWISAMAFVVMGTLIGFGVS